MVFDDINALAEKEQALEALVESLVSKKLHNVSIGDKY